MSIEQSVKQLNSIQIRCFLCFCVERWYGVVAHALGEEALPIRAAIDDVWQRCLLKQQAKAESIHRNAIQGLFQSFREEPERFKLPFGFVSQIQEDIIVAVLNMLDYESSQSESSTLVCIKRIQDAAYQTAQGLLGTYTIPSNMELLIYEDEIKAQEDCIQTVQSEPFSIVLIAKVRTQADLWGKQLVEKMQYHSIQALRGENAGQINQLLIKALSDPIQVIRLEAAHELFQKARGDDRVIDSMLHVMEKTDDNKLSLYLAAIFGEWKEVQATEALIRLLSITSAKQQEIAIESLGKIGNRKATSVLIQMLRSNVKSVAQNAAVALGRINDPLSIEPLTALLQDSDKQVCYFAGLALAEMNKK